MLPSGGSRRFPGAVPFVRGSVFALAMALSLTGCFYGFTGGGLPSHVRTIAVIPFENQTPVTDVQREISDSLRARLVDKLGLRAAAESKASAVVRGTIRRYESGIPIGYDARSRAATNVQRMLEMTLDVDVIDQQTGKSLWSRKGFLAQGQYQEGQEAVGRAQAVDKLVNAIVEGVQSQW